MSVKDIKVDYDVVTQFAGHQPNKSVPIIDAAKDIFSRVKEKAMQCAVGGKFIEFNNVNDLIDGLTTAVNDGLSIRVCDMDIGG